MIYLLLTIIIKAEFQNSLTNFIKVKGYTFENVDMIPRSFLRWKAIFSDSNNYYVVYPHYEEVRLLKYSNKIALPERLKMLEVVKSFLTYARYPVMFERNNKFEFFNLVFSPKTYRLVLYNSDENISYSISGYDLMERFE